MPKVITVEQKKSSNDILGLLKGGDRRSIGPSDEAAEMVGNDPKLFPKLIAGLRSEDSLVRIRAADAAEKATREHPELLRPYKKELLGLIAESNEQEIRWHLAVMVPRLALNGKERQVALSLLTSFLEDRSSIGKTFALQGLADLAKNDVRLRARVIEILCESARTGTAAMKARSRKLLSRMERG